MFDTLIKYSNMFYKVINKGCSFLRMGIVLVDKSHYMYLKLHYIKE